MATDPLLSRALGVLAKADSTSYEPERAALVYGGYVLLARYLAANPGPPSPDGRRRERRLVVDRRQGGEAGGRRGPASSPGRAGVRSANPSHGYLSEEVPADPDAGTLIDRRI